MKDWPLGLWRSLSGTGLLLGTLFFAASLTPTLIPRTYLTQGVLGGGVFAIGYGLGVFWRWLWGYMELPTPEGTHPGHRQSRHRVLLRTSRRRRFYGAPPNGRIRSAS